MSLLHENFEFVGSSVENDRQCGCCTAEILPRDIQFMIQQFQNDIFKILFTDIRVS